MKIEESFVKGLTEIQKRFPVLKQPSDTKVTIRVAAILGICKEFHAKGWKDSDLLGGAFGDLLGLNK